MMALKRFIIILFCFVSVIGYAQLKVCPDTIETFAIPEKAAEFPGGMSKLVKHLTDNFTNKIDIKNDDAGIFRSPLVQWTVDETGKVVEVRILRSTNISEMDKLLLTVVENMPLWKPAENGRKKVRQEFQLPITVCFK